MLESREQKGKAGWASRVLWNSEESPTNVRDNLA
jgi:hypothetical protein